MRLIKAIIILFAFFAYQAAVALPQPMLISVYLINNASISWGTISLLKYQSGYPATYSLNASPNYVDPAIGDTANLVFLMPNHQAAHFNLIYAYPAKIFCRINIKTIDSDNVEVTAEPIANPGRYTCSYSGDINSGDLKVAIELKSKK